jgi:hypothetical protein
LKVHEIVPGSLYQRGRTHSLTLEEKVVRIKEIGITHAFALAPAFPDEGLVSMAAIGLVRFTHYPITDGVLRSGTYLNLVAAELASEIEAGGCVMTMCNAGRNRSGLLSALIVRHLFGIPGADAIEIVQARRPNALANDYFVEFLLALT